MAARKILLDLAVSLDGFIEGPNGEIDWCIMEPEMKFADFLDQVDTILFGRISYDLFLAYETEEDDKQKIVFSHTRKGTEGKTTYINDNIVEEINRLKEQPGKDIWLYGGSRLITTFVNFGLVDEFRLSVHPVILGAGKSLFTDIEQRVNLKMVASNVYPSGVVQLIYHKEV